MKLKKYYSLLTVLIAGLIGFGIHKTLFYFMVSSAIESQFQYSLSLLYLLFTLFSVFIVYALIMVYENMKNYVGFAFLFLTTLKMIVAYLLVKPILATHLPHTAIEKTNFFLIFIYFLIIETLVTIRILNNKQ